MSIKRINEFPDGSGSLSTDDVFLFMDDPSGDAITKKVSLSQLNSILSGNSGIVPTNINTSNITDFNSSVSGLLPITSIVAGSGITVDYNSNIVTINTLLVSNPSGITGASAISNIVQISQADYNALATVDSNTLYVIN